MLDRKTVLWGITDTDQRLCLSHLCDRLDASEKTQRTTYTRFLTPLEANLARERLSSYDVRFSGGFDGAERVMAAFVPNEWEDIDFPLCAIKIKALGERKLSHRDYLGSLLSLGIERELVGDIVILDDGAAVVVCREIAEFIMMNVSKVASSGVRLSLMEDASSLGSQKSFKEISATVSSMRLDCVVSALASFSRSKAAECISRSNVNVNYKTQESVSYIVKDGDVISVRGYGKAIVETNLALTKKGRVHINIRKYI